MMEGMSLEAFHFLRPFWLLLLPVFPLLAWGVRRAARKGDETAFFVKPHLAKALTVGGGEHRRFQPVDGVVLVGALATIAAAGPTWTRVVDPFAPESPAMAIVLEVSETMLAVDVEPTRLERARIKIDDLLDLRAGAPTALVAYAGTAHRILPPTEDPEIIRRFVEGLVPSVMPRDGQNATAALARATEALSSESDSGVILFVGDGFDAADLAAFEAHREAGGMPTLALVIGTETGGAIKDGHGGFMTDDSGRRLVASVDGKVLERFSSEGGVSVTRATLDQRDLRRIDRESIVVHRARQQQGGDLGWEDRGWMVLWPAGLLGLVWFRRGWTMRWAGTAALLLCAFGLTPRTADAGEVADLFLTPDQQGRWAYEHLDFSRAGDVFEDARWKGQAYYEAGRYPEAAEAFGRVLGADGLFAMGNALVKGREYRRAIDAYRQALAENPDHAAASHNLILAEVILEKLTKQRADEDRGDGSEGADEIRFDSESKEGKSIQIGRDEGMTEESAEAWMRTVDPGISEFLKIRFELEMEDEESP
jgi:Ca-activated chloride channel family protein